MRLFADERLFADDADADRLSARTDHSFEGSPSLSLFFSLPLLFYLLSLSFSLSYSPPLYLYSLSPYLILPLSLSFSQSYYLSEEIGNSSEESSGNLFLIIE